MYVVRRQAYGQMQGYGQEPPIAATNLPATQQSTGQAVGLVLAFFSTLMFFTSIIAQGDR